MLSNDSVTARHRESQGKTLKDILNNGQTVILPTAFDALSARLIDEAGFDALGVGGFGMSASVLGMPDAGFLDLETNLTHLRHIVRCTDLPVLADADTGYGGLANVAFTTREIERTGAAGLHLEDQEYPKICPQLTDYPNTVPTDLAVRKLKRALDARDSEDFVIVARTDSHGPDVWERVEAFAAAGVDAINTTSIAFDSKEEYSAFIKQCPLPLLLPMNPKMSRLFTVDELRDLGASVVSVPLTVLFASITGMRAALNELKDKANYLELAAGHVSMAEVEKLLQVDELSLLE